MVKKKWVLGRESDPRVPSDLSRLNLMCRRWGWSALGRLGTRRVVSRLFPEPSLCYFDVDRFPRVRGKVALTLDDGFCGVDNPGGDKVEEVRQVLAAANARATFFVVGDHIETVDPKKITRLVKDGHELANHNSEDRPYHEESEGEFEADLERVDSLLARFGEEHLCPWYRAPHARLSPAMARVLAGKGKVHVMPDCFAHDSAIPDPEFISRFVLGTVLDGSVILVHMPEAGVREWNLQALRLILKGLTERGLQAITFSELHQLAFFGAD